MRDRAEPVVLALLWLALFALYLVMHPYRGVQGDALIYVTRAFASRAIAEGDMLFAHEHQTGLTVFGVLLRLLLAVLPVADAARWLALCGAAVWFGGLCLLSRAMARAAHAPARAALAMAALVALAPLSYAPEAAFTAGEVLAVPRPFAEGLVLAALALCLEERWRTAIFALACAMVFHPLMGAAGAGVALVWVALRLRRRGAVALACACLVVACGAALAHARATFDADWLAILRLRTSYLFLTQAPASFWTDLLLRGVSLVVAARLCGGRLRLLLHGVLVASALGVACALAFADLWPCLLITQAQPWRVLFIPATLAPAAVALVAFRGEGPAARVTLALLACALITRDAPALSALFSLCALALHVSPTLARRATPRLATALWIVAAAAWVGFDLLNLFAFGQIVAAAPPGFVLPWSYLWVLRPLALPLGALVVVLALRGASPRPWIAAACCALAVAAAWLRFDDRAPVDVSLESRQAPALAAALPPGQGAVLWLGLGKEAWYWLDRPNWVAPVQASSIVFSRDLARDWSARTRVLIALGLAPPEALANQAFDAVRDWPPGAMVAVCAREDGPSAIVAPLRAGDATPEGTRRVPAPAPSFLLQADGGLRFETVASYAVWTCAPSAN